MAKEEQSKAQLSVGIYADLKTDIRWSSTAGRIFPRAEELMRADSREAVETVDLVGAVLMQPRIFYQVEERLRQKELKPNEKKIEAIRRRGLVTPTNVPGSETGISPLAEAVLRNALAQKNPPQGVTPLMILDSLITSTPEGTWRTLFEKTQT